MLLWPSFGHPDVVGLKLPQSATIGYAVLGWWELGVQNSWRATGSLPPQKSVT